MSPQATSFLLNLVTITPKNDEHHKAIALYSARFWQRETVAGIVRLICVDNDGVPHADKFIFVEARYVHRIVTTTHRRPHEQRISDDG